MNGQFKFDPVGVDESRSMLKSAKECLNSALDIFASITEPVECVAAYQEEITALSKEIETIEKTLNNTVTLYYETEKANCNILAVVAFNGQMNGQIDIAVDENTNYQSLIQGIGDESYFQFFGDGFGMSENLFDKLLPSGMEGLSDVEKEAYTAQMDALVNKMCDRYHMSKDDAIRTLYAIDNAGASSYATFGNQIIAKYKSVPEQFERDFGFPLYIVDDEKHVSLNYEELLADLWLVNNMYSEPYEYYGKEAKDYLYYHDEEGNLIFNTSQYEDVENGLRVVGEQRDFMGREEQREYFEKKQIAGTSYSSTQQMSQVDLVKYVTRNLGNDVSIGAVLIGSDENPIHMVNAESGEEYIGDSSFYHSVYVLGLEDDNLIVSSWGDKYKIKLEEICGDEQENGVYFVAFDRKEGGKLGDNTVYFDGKAMLDPGEGGDIFGI